MEWLAVLVIAALILWRLHDVAKGELEEEL